MVYNRLTHGIIIRNEVSRMAKFNLGRTVMTRAIADLTAEDDSFANEITSAFNRYTDCNWGDMCVSDKQLNDNAIENGEDRILAAYETSKGKVYIITEWDRSYTTILFAKDY
jgi:hypothetical protein